MYVCECVHIKHMHIFKKLPKNSVSYIILSFLIVKYYIVILYFLWGYFLDLILVDK